MAVVLGTVDCVVLLVYFLYSQSGSVMQRYTNDTVMHNVCMYAVVCSILFCDGERNLLTFVFQILSIYIILSFECGGG